MYLKSSPATCEQERIKDQLKMHTFSLFPNLFFWDSSTLFRVNNETMLGRSFLSDRVLLEAWWMGDIVGQGGENWSDASMQHRDRCPHTRMLRRRPLQVFTRRHSKPHAKGKNSSSKNQSSYIFSEFYSLIFCHLRFCKKSKLNLASTFNSIFYSNRSLSVTLKSRDVARYVRALS